MRIAAAATALLLGLGALPAAQAQVSVGYSALTTATMSRLRVDALSLRERSSFGVAGFNVEPIDGSGVYTPTTIWRLRDTGQPSSLSLRLDDPIFEAQSSNTNTQVVQAARREDISVTIAAPLNNALINYALSPFAPVIVPATSPLSITVFP